MPRKKGQSARKHRREDLTSLPSSLLSQEDNCTCQRLRLLREEVKKRHSRTRKPSFGDSEISTSSYATAVTTQSQPAPAVIETFADFVVSIAIAFYVLVIMSVVAIPTPPPEEAKKLDVAAISDENSFFYLDPYLTRYAEVCEDSSPKFKDVWLCSLGLRGRDHLPALPEEYQLESDQHRVFYTRGAPGKYTHDQFKAIFLPFAYVDKCPCIIDLVSHETFRWAILRNKSQAENLPRNLDGKKFKDFTLSIHVSLPPGRSLTISTHTAAVKPVHMSPQNPMFPGVEEQDTVHGHPVPASNEELNTPTTRRRTLPPEFIPRASKCLDNVANEPSGQITQPIHTANTAFGDATINTLSKWEPYLYPPNMNATTTPLAPPGLGFSGSNLSAEFLTFQEREVDNNLSSLYANFSVSPAYPTQATLSASPVGMVSPRVGVIGEAPLFKEINAAGQILHGNPGQALQKKVPEPANNRQLVSLLKKSLGSRSTAAQGLDRVQSVLYSTVTSQPSVVQRTVRPSISQATQTKQPELAIPKVVTQPSRTLPSVALEPASVPAPVPELKEDESKFRSHMSSWANIAGTASPASRIIDLHPDRIYTAPRLKRVGRIPDIQSTRNAETMAEQVRVVFILEIPTCLTYNDIQDAIREGPLHSINFCYDANPPKKRFAAIVFQYAKDAEAFTSALLKERADKKPERFRFIAEAVRGPPFPLDSTLLAMAAPIHASRRLTLVKSSFFSAFGLRQIRQFCEKHVESSMIQLIWIYNGGNATIVFTNVAAAMTIKGEFDKVAAVDGLPEGHKEVYTGLITTYSKDPCILSMDLKTTL